MPQFSLVGANIVVYANNAVLKEVQSVNFEVDYGEQEIRGIDSPYPQEIAATQVSVSGSMTLIRQKNSGGLQAKNLRPLFTDIGASPYIQLRVHDRQSGEDIISLPYAKIIKESHSAAAKGVYHITVQFSGLLPLFALDRA
jgi:hypothetical protein